jgi:ABC-type glycerol-3-phosphate transport system substrate-binding protein
MTPSRPLSRRRFVQLAAIAAVGAPLLAACTQASPSSPTAAAPASAPTTAPTTAPATAPATATVATQPAATAAAATPTTATAAPTPTAQPAASTSAPAKIRWATLSGQDQPYLQIPQLVAKQFTEKNPNIQVNVEPVAGDYGRPKLAADLAAGTLADIFFSHSGLIQILADAGITKSMDPYLQAAKGGELKKTDFYPALIVAGSTAKGETHLLGMGADAHTIHYNRQMLADAGLKPPKDDWSWSDLLDYARKLTKQSADGKTVERWGMGASNAWISWAVGPTYSAGGEWIKNDGGAQTFPSTSPEFIKGMHYLWDGVKDHSFAGEDEIKAMTDYHHAFIDGKLAMCDGARWSVPVLRKATFDWDVAPIPRDTRYGVGSGTAGWGIGAKTPVGDAVWKLIQYIFSEEGYKPWVANYAVVPTLVTLKDSDIWRKLPGPPYNNDAYITAIKWAYLRPRGVAYEDGGFVDKQLADAYQRYVKGGVKLEDAMKTMKDKFDAFLKDNPATVVEWNPGKEF